MSKSGNNEYIPGHPIIGPKTEPVMAKYKF